jgi:hypothetical protein
MYQEETGELIFTVPSSPPSHYDSLNAASRPTFTVKAGDFVSVTSCCGLHHLWYIASIQESVIPPTVEILIRYPNKNGDIGERWIGLTYARLLAESGSLTPFKPECQHYPSCTM